MTWNLLDFKGVRNCAPLLYNLVKHFIPSHIDQHLPSLPMINSPLKYAAIWILLCAHLTFELYLSPLPVVSSMICNSTSLVPTLNFVRSLHSHRLMMIIVANFHIFNQLSGSSLSFYHHSITSSTGYYIFSQYAHNCHQINVHVQCVDCVTFRKRINSNRVIPRRLHYSFDYD